MKRSIQRSIHVYIRRAGTVVDILFVSLYELIEFYNYGGIWRTGVKIGSLLHTFYSYKPILYKKHKASVFKENKRNRIGGYGCKLHIPAVIKIEDILSSIEDTAKKNNWDIYIRDKDISGVYYDKKSKNLVYDLKSYYYGN